MKSQFMKFILISLIICSAMSVFAQAENAKQTKPVVMILGTYHMGNPGRDLNNVKADDVRAEKRQKEIADFLLVLKKFKPSKIALEIAPDETKYLTRYDEYLNGKYELAANEIDQIGFRLAKELGQKQVYGIDWKGDFDFDKVRASAKTNGQETALGAMLDFGKQETARMDDLLKTGTVTDVFRYMNDDRKLEEMHKPYLAMLRIGAGRDFAGVGLVRDWYERNMKIYSSIARLAESPNERVLVIIGAGHAKLLQQFTNEAGEMQLEKLDRYL